MSEPALCSFLLFATLFYFRYMYFRDALQTNSFTVLHFKICRNNALGAGEAAIRRC